MLTVPLLIESDPRATFQNDAKKTYVFKKTSTAGLHSEQTTKYGNLMSKCTSVGVASIKWWRCLMKLDVNRFHEGSLGIAATLRKQNKENIIRDRLT